MIHMSAEHVPRNAGRLMDQLLETDSTLRSLSRKLHLRQDRLKRAVSPHDYRLYLVIEELLNERCFELVSRVWALARNPAPQGGSGLKRPSRIGAEYYTYRVRRSDEGGFVGCCEEYPCLEWHHSDRAQALTGIVRFVRELEASRRW